MKIEVRYSVPADVPPIVADARPADVIEFAALGYSVERAMVHGMEVSDWTGTCLIDEVPVCMFGVAAVDILAGMGQPWLVTSNAVARHERMFLRRCRAVVDAMLRSYPRLTNIVHDDNVRAIKWLRWLGFEFKDTPMVVNGVAFRQFRKGAF